jgi:hypothetical protein
MALIPGTKPPSRNPPKSIGRILLPFMRGTLRGRFLFKKKGNLRCKVPSSIEVETFLRVSCPKHRLEKSGL